MLLLLALALADTVTLENGATLDVRLARYELRGDCQMTVLEGPLRGAIVILPCERLQRFERVEEGAAVADGPEEGARGAEPAGDGQAAPLGWPSVVELEAPLEAPIPDDEPPLAVEEAPAEKAPAPADPRVAEGRAIKF